MSAGVQRGSLSAAVSYNAPSVSSAAGSNCAASGASSLSVSGVAFSLFGVSAGVRTGGSASGATLWMSGSSVVSRYGSGLGIGVGVVVSAGLQGGSLTLGVSYDAAKVSSVGLLQVAVSGATSVAVFGSSLGDFGASVTGRVGASSAMSSVWSADSVMLCRVSRGVGKPVYVVVSAMRQAGSLSLGMSFAAPQLSSVRDRKSVV